MTLPAIYIPTRGRVGRQITLGQLPPALRERTTLVTYPEERDRYQLYHGREVHAVVARPKECQGMAAVRQWILKESSDDRLVMLDDDVRFFIKTGAPDAGGRRKIIAATPRDKIEMMEWLHATLGTVAHASLTPRSLNFDHPGPHIEATRMMYVLAYDRKRTLAAGADFTAGLLPTSSMSDFHMTLQLLRAGLVNVVSTNYCTNPSVSNSAGGCSVYRTLETQNESAERLARLHPGYVKVVERKGWKGMDAARKDVIVQWRKAYEESQQ
jgi:hypothetical protein